MLALAQARGGFPFGVVPSHTVCIIAYSNRPSSNFVPPGEFAPDAVNAILNSYRGLPEWGGSAEYDTQNQWRDTALIRDLRLDCLSACCLNGGSDDPAEFLISAIIAPVLSREKRPLATICSLRSEAGE